MVYTFVRSKHITRLYPPQGTFRTIDGIRLHYHFLSGAVSGQHRRTVLFLHGASGNSLDPLRVFSSVFQGRYNLLFVDRPGLGHSGRDWRRHTDPLEQASTIARLLDQLGIDECLVVGHSFGASVTAALALARPEKVAGLVFLAPATHPWPGGVNWYYTIAAAPVIGPLFCWTLTLPVAERRAAGAMACVFAPDPVDASYADGIDLPLLFRPSSFRANSQDVARLKSHLARQADRYSEIWQPAVIITGDSDQVVWPSIHSEGLLRDLPNASMVVLEETGHMPHYTRTERVCGEIQRMLDDLDGKAGCETDKSVSGL